MSKHIISLLIIFSITSLNGCVKSDAPPSLVESIEVVETIISQDFWNTANLDTLSNLITEGANVNAIDESGFTPLMFALTTGQIQNNEMASLLLKSGADVNAKNTAGMTPLMLTIVQNPINVLDVLRLLITSGANVNAKDNYGYTPLMHAVTYSKSTRVIDLLIRNRAKVNDVDNIGMTALMHVAQSSGNSNMAKSLLSYEADINAVDNSSMTALAYLMRDNYTTSAHEILTLFIELEDIDLTIRDSDGVLSFNHALFNQAIFNSRPYWTLKDMLMKEGIQDLNFIQRLRR